MAKSRGLYGGGAGDEKRGGAATCMEHYLDNDTVEGQEASILRRMLKEKNFDAARKYMEELRTTGWNTVRIQCVYAKASLGVKF